MGRALDMLSLSSAELKVLRRRSRDTIDRSGVASTRQQNLALMTRLLYEQGPSTRPQLARLSGLSAPTVAALVAELVESRTVKDLGVIAEARVGKPASKVEIDAQANVCAVLNLTETVFTASLIDLDGVVVWNSSLDTGGATGEDAVQFTVDLAVAAKQASAVRLIGISIASPGLVDPSGRVVVADRLGWRDVDLASVVQRATSLPTLVGNDVNLMALGLRQQVQDSHAGLLTITLENGIGAAVVMNDEVLLGDHFAAGEIGHITVFDSETPCVCGRYGCLEQIANSRLLAERLEEIPESEHEGELARCGAILGNFLTPVLGMLNVLDVALVGPAAILEGAFADEVLGAIRARNRPAVAEGISVHVHSDVHTLIATGAASAIVERVLDVRARLSIQPMTAASPV